MEELKGHTDEVCCVAYTPDGKELVSGGWDRTLKHWDLSELLHHQDRDETLYLPFPVPHGHLLHGNAKSGTTSPFGASLVHGHGEGRSVCTLEFKGNKNSVHCTAVLPDGRWVVSGGDDRDVPIRGSSTAEPLVLLRSHNSTSELPRLLLNYLLVTAKISMIG